MNLIVKILQNLSISHLMIGNKLLIYMSKVKTGIGEIYDTIFNTPNF